MTLRKLMEKKYFSWIRCTLFVCVLLLIAVVIGKRYDAKRIGTEGKDDAFVVQQKSVERINTSKMHGITPASAKAVAAESGTKAVEAGDSSGSYPVTSIPSASVTQSQAVASASSLAEPVDFATINRASDERIDQWMGEPDPRSGLARRISLMRRPGFKYPLLRREELLRGPDENADVLKIVAESVADHLIVRPIGGASASEIVADLAEFGLKIREIKPLSGNVLVSFAGNQRGRYEQVMERLNEHPDVALVSRDSIVYALATPNDPSYSDLWGLHNTGQTGGSSDADIDAPEAWDVTTGSTNVVVAVIDTGIQHDHPDLAANMWVNAAEIPGNGVDDDGNGFIDDVYGYDFYNLDGDPMDDHDHGTHCAGTIGAVANNSIGVAGVNWDVRLMGLKFLSGSGSGSSADAVEAIYYATDMGVKILSNSWGGGGDEAAMRDAIEYARTNDVLLIFAAGNDGNNTDFTPTYPASLEYDNIVSVAATDHADELAYFSNYGAESVDLAAPGVAILSTLKGSAYGEFSGTSMATPHVAGVAGLLLAHTEGHSSYAFLKQALLQGVDERPALQNNVLTGGRLNAASSLGLVMQAPFTGFTWVELDDGTNAPANGNGDGFINPGETIALDLVLMNTGADASNLTATLSLASGTDPWISITDGTEGVATVSGGGHETTIPDAFALVVDAGLTNTPYAAELDLVVAGDSGAWTNAMTLTVRDSFEISGIVRLDGAAFTNCKVLYRGPANGMVDPAPDGTFSFNVPDGSYSVYASLITPDDPAGPFYFHGTAATIVGGPDQSGVELAFATHSITGSVTLAATGDPLSGVDVRTFVTYPWLSGDGIYGRGRSTQTDVNGDYQFDILMPVGDTGTVIYVSATDKTWGNVSDGTDRDFPPDQAVNLQVETVILLPQPDRLSLVLPPNVVTTLTVRVYNIGTDDTRAFVSDSQDWYDWGAGTYDWQEISGVGSMLSGWVTDVDNPENDTRSQTIPLGFDFPFFQTVSGQAHIHELGFMSFSANRPANSVMPHVLCPSGPYYNPPDLIAAFYDSHDLSANGGVVYYHNPDPDTCVIQWHDIEGSLNWQVVVREDGYFKIQWKNVGTLFAQQVGIQDGNGTRGFVVDYATDASEYVYTGNGKAVEFTPRHVWMEPHAQYAEMVSGSYVDVPVTIDTTGMAVGDYDEQLVFMKPHPSSGRPFHEAPYPIDVHLRVQYDATAPVALAGPDREARAGIGLTLDGSASRDPVPGPQPLTYHWEQVSGPKSLPMLGTNTSRAFVDTVLDDFSQVGDYVFRLTVSDGERDATDTVTISLQAENVVLYKIADVSGSSIAERGPDKLTDGITDLSQGTCWYSSPDTNDQRWFEFDLGGSYLVNGAAFYWDDYYIYTPTNLHLQAWDEDAQSWQTLVQRGADKVMEMYESFSFTETVTTRLRCDFVPYKPHLYNSHIMEFEAYGLRVLDLEPGVNNTPVPSNMLIHVNAGEFVPFTLYADDPDGDPLTYQLAGEPSHGSLYQDPPDLVYHPDPNFHGTDTVQFVAYDGKALSDLGTVTLVVEKVNRAPSPVNDRVMIETGATARVEVLINDIDEDGDDLVVVSVDSPANGTATNDGRVVRYTPDPGFEGVEVFGYTVADPTGATASAEVQIYVGDPLLVHLPLNGSGNDTSGNGRNASVSGVSWIAGDGGLDTSGAADVLTTSDSITIPGDMELSGTAISRRTVAFWIKPDHVGLDWYPQVVYQEGATATEGNYTGPLLRAVISESGALLVHALDPDNPDYSTRGCEYFGLQRSEWNHVAIVLNTSTGLTDRGLLLFVDGEEVAAVQTTPLGARGGDIILGNRSQKDYGGPGLYDELRIYKWALNASEIADLASQGTIDNAAPTAGNLDLLVYENTPRGFALEGSDPDALDVLLYDIVTGPTNGTLTVEGAQAVYTPSADYLGEDNFTYLVSDGKSSSGEATVSLTVVETNTPPVADAGTNKTVETWALVTLDGTGSTDADGDILTYRWQQWGGPETLQPTDTDQTNAHVVIETPGTYTFRLTVSDGLDSDSDEVVLTAEEGPTNNYPTAAFAVSPTTGLVPVAVTFDASASSDPDGDSLSYIWTLGNGESTNGVSFVYTYTEAGSYLVELTVSDGRGGVDTASTTLVFTAATPPVAPSGVTATGVATNQMDVSWQDNSHDEEAFVVERSIALEGPWTVAVITSADVTSWSDMTLSANMTRYYRIAASNAYGLSAFSEVAAGETPGPTFILIDTNVLNGSFEDNTQEPGGTIKDTVAVWTNGLNVDHTQVRDNLAPPHGDWALVIGNGDDGTLGGLIRTEYMAADGDTFDVSLALRSGWQWASDTTLNWRLFTTDDDTSGGALTEIASGAYTGLTSGWETKSWATNGPAGPEHAGRKVWLEIWSANASTNAGGQFAQIDQVRLVVQHVAIEPPPVITASPTNLTVTAGQPAMFDVSASGEAPLFYQWRKDGGALGAATNAFYMIPAVVMMDTGDYDVIVSNAAGSVTSSVASLTVNKAAATVTFSNLSHIYSAEPKSPASETSPTGLMVTLTYDGSLEAPVNAGSYQVVAAVVDDNYQGGATDTLNITRAPVVVTAADQTKTEEEVDPVFAYTVEPSLFNGDGFSGALTREAGNISGYYAILQGTLTAGANYAVTYVEGTLTILTAYGFVDADADGIDDAWWGENSHHFESGATATTLVEHAGHEMTVKDIFIAGLEPGGSNLFEVSAVEMAPGSSTLELTFTTVSNRYYDVLYKTNLTDTGWRELTNNVPGGTNGTFTVSDFEKDVPHRFYRIRVKLGNE